MTPSASILSSVHPYSGNDCVTVGNGTQLPISYTWHGTLSTPQSIFSVNDILMVPHLSTNLLSVRKFVSDNNCSIEFDPFGFDIKDLKTKSSLLRCNSSVPLYPLPSPSCGLVDTYHSAFATIRASLNL
ncbi:hypothetical protein A4A49_61997 [Nicotiana attenuata]|uniref:Uncharacterized protein n=1 Tax=Nicotiana attenuata TaxID=49451 RepID=A0A1J6KP83_NICAT|nr:hypothetical protein A4A49_61997 [Nicotiana attenuata]